MMSQVKGHGTLGRHLIHYILHGWSTRGRFSRIRTRASGKDSSSQQLHQMDAPDWSHNRMEGRKGEESSGVPLDGNKSPCTSEAPTEWETTELIPAETLLASLGAFKGRMGERSSSRSSCVKDCGWRVCKPHLNKGEQMCYRVTRICNTLMKAKAVYGAIMRSTKKRKRLRRGHMEQSWWRVMSGGFWWISEHHCIPDIRLVQSHPVGLHVQL